MVAHRSKPVVLLVFNRPECTRSLMSAVRSARPSTLLVVADGPRPNVEHDFERCRKVRKITEEVDWDCEVVRLYRERNLGCRDSVTGGLDWVFEHVEEAIILEDDCVPAPSFFPYCTELLDRYRADERVGAISGDNFQFGRKVTDASYYFSRYCHIWGWATWRRAWEKFDPAMDAWPKARETDWLRRLTCRPEEAHYWKLMFEDSWKRPAGGMETWDIPWLFSCWQHGMLTVTPSVNMVANVGFGGDSTHTSGGSPLTSLHGEELKFPLVHPRELCASAEADREIDRTCFSGAGPLALLCKARLPVPVHLLRRASRMWEG